MLRTHIFREVVIVAVSVFVAVATIARDTTSPNARDKKFVRSAMEWGNAQIAFAHLAIKKSGSEDVKQFGQKMIDDHAHLADQIPDVAKKEHIHPSEGTNSKDKTTEAKLKKLSGGLFDKAYIEVTVKDHRQDLDEFNREANTGNDTAIKRAASQGALVIGEQLEQAKQIARSHNAEPGP